MEPKWDGCKKLLGGEKGLKVNRGGGVKRGREVGVKNEITQVREGKG